MTGRSYLGAVSEILAEFAGLGGMVRPDALGRARTSHVSSMIALVRFFGKVHDMNLDVVTLNESFRILLLRKDFFTERFYELLFSRLPHVKPLFQRADLLSQPQHFARALEIIVSLADDSENLLAYLKATGAKHVSYGVSAADFPMVIPLLLEAMEAAIGHDLWRDKYRAAWLDALGLVVSGMCAGAASVDHLETWDTDEVAIDDAEEIPPATPHFLLADSAPGVGSLGMADSLRSVNYRIKCIEATLAELPANRELANREILQVAADVAEALAGLYQSYTEFAHRLIRLGVASDSGADSQGKLLLVKHRGSAIGR